MGRLKSVSIGLIEMAVVEAMPCQRRRRYLTPHEALQRTCISNPQLTGGKPGYFIKGLEKYAREGIDQTVAALRKAGGQVPQPKPKHPRKAA